MSERWWYCLKHQAVEQGSVCPNTDRMGPYETSTEAAAAMTRAAERNEAWDSDPSWKDD
jgi:nitrate/TMAO reductase-like tetraheme cytochrome c subunit